MSTLNESGNSPIENLDYWKNYLQGSPLQIPLCYTGKGNGTISRTIAFKLNSQMQKKVESFLSFAKYSASSFYTALWAALVSRYADRDNIVVLSADPFVPLKVSMTKETKLFELITGIISQLGEGKRHPLLNIDQLIESLSFDFKSNAKSGIVAIREVLNPSSQNQNLKPFDVLFEFAPNNIESFRIIFNDKLEDFYIKQMGDHFISLLEGVISQTDVSLCSIPIITADESQRILFDFNKSDVNFNEDITIPQLFEEQVLRTPENIAVVYKNESITYRDLNEKANRLGHAIRGFNRTMYKEDILPDTPIGICMDRGVGMIVAMLGILKAGCAYMPIDPAYPSDRLRFMMDDALAPLVVTEIANLDKLLFLNETDYGVISLDGGWGVISKYSGNNPEPINNSRNLAYIIYTSGSTGRPKGAMIEHRSVVNYAFFAKKKQNIKPGDHVLQFSSINFDMSVGDIFPALLFGATLYITHNELRMDPEALYNYIKEQSINIIFLTSAVLHAMPKEDVPSLRSIYVGGDISDRETLDFWRKGRTLFNVYGPTECTVISNGCIYDEEILSTEIGGPNDNMKIYVLDKFLNPVPVGVPGELCIGGIGVSRGYLNRPELTEERFIKNPFVTQEEKAGGRNLRLYKSGDRVRWLKNGSIDFLGRVDFQVKIRGFRVEPGEIEAVLSSHGEIKECAVVPFDEGTEKRLVAYYVPVPETSPAFTDLKAHLAEFLPYFMIPTVFMELAEMPMSPSGKIERRLLPPPALGLVCAKDKTPVEYIAPQTPHEVLISEILCVIMNLEKISVDSDIFDMGVHSLMAAKIASDIRKKFSKKIELKDIFEHRNIQSLAKFISEITGNEKAELISISRVPNRKNIPLSFQQEQIWFLSKLVPNNRAYNFQFSLSLKGKLDKNILVQFLNEMVIRHEILRTTFHESTQGPVQIVHAPWKVKLNEADLTGLPEDKRAEEAEKLMEKVLSHSFNFSKLPLVSWSLFKISEEEHIFLHMEHHFLHDGWEAGIFLREMKAFYIACQEGKPSPLQELPIQYADYAIWQRNNLSGERLEEKISYWINKIKDYPTVLNLPTDHPRPSVQTFNGDAIRLNLKRSLYHSLREFSRNNKVTLFNTMYSAFAILISKYSRQSQFLIGTGVANRNLKETEGLMGMFVNTVLLYSDLSSNPTFKELLNKTKESMIYDAAHYDIPFMHIVERMKAGVTPGRNPLFQVLFAFHDSDIPLLDFAGLHGELLERHNATAKVDMNVICIPRAEQHVATESAQLETEDLTIVWEYNSDIFNRETIQGMLEHYLTLLEEIIKSPEKNIEDVNILLPKEKECILFGFNDNAVNYDRNLTMIDMFEEQVKMHSGSVAIVHNGKELTYQKLNEEANKLANRLKKINQNSSTIQSQDNKAIGICMERGINMVIGFLGILKSGCSYVPIPPHYPENRLRFIMEDSALKIILTQSNLMKELPFLAKEEERLVIPLDKEIVDNADISDKNPGNKISTEDIAYIIYTSGSTGNPKGVTIPHSAVTNLVTSMKADVIDEDEIIAQCANYAFDGSIYEFWGALLSGATMVIIDSAKVENLDLLKKEISDNKITSAFFTTALFNTIVDCDSEILFPLKSVLFGGEAVNVGCAKKLLESKPYTLNVYNGYGPTECTFFSTCCLITDKYKDSDFIPIGKPLHNYTAYILDNKATPLPIGVPGELYIGGDSLAIGYLNRPELTAEKFITNPFVTNDEKRKNRNTRLYKTGDLVRWLPDGNIEFLGRTDFQVKIRGFRIEPEEIEAVLLRHEEVKQCVVIPWNHHLIAYWVPRNNSVAQEDMKTFLARQLPEFMIPTAFIKMESFQLNTNYKVERSKLPIPKLEDLMSSKREYNPPVTHTEVTLADIWKELLKLDKISVNDNFFEIGGNSILTVRMLSSVKRQLGADVNISQMFAQPTIAYLASFIDGTGITSGASENNLSLALKDSEIIVKVENTTLISDKESASIFLTGITGFLGLYLLDGLITKTKADIYCLVRGEDNADIQRRYEATLEAYKKEHLKNHPRVKLVKGNLAEINLGMDDSTFEMMKEKIDSIYHSGAMVHHMFDYNTLRKSNVLSTVELLKIAATGKKKTLNYISTLGVASIRDANGFQVEVDTEDSPISTNGYTLSKWVSEKILSNVKGVDINIFRPGNITGDSKEGICPPEKNHALLVMKGCIQMGAAPDWQRSVEMMPVDTLSNAIIELASISHGFNIFNMSNPLEINWKEYIVIIKSCGFKLDLLPANIWKEKHLAMADEKNAMYPIREFYLRERKDIMTREWKAFSRWNSKEVREKVHSLGIHYPEQYDDYLRLIINYLKEISFLTN